MPRSRKLISDINQESNEMKNFLWVISQSINQYVGERYINFFFESKHEFSQEEIDNSDWLQSAIAKGYLEEIIEIKREG